jgi:ABC-type ATPase involved in cell division
MVLRGLNFSPPEEEGNILDQNHTNNKYCNTVRNSHGIVVQDFRILTSNGKNFSLYGA